MKRVFIVHGWEADPESNWFSWMKNELEKNGIEAVVPAMPNSAHPNCAEWVRHLNEVVGQADEETFFVGHSLGVITILKYLNNLKEEEKAGGVVLVSGSTEDPGFPELVSFFTEPLDLEKVKKAANSFVVVHSDDDPVVPVAMGEMMSEALGAEFIMISGGGHLNAGNGHFELPIVLEKILEILK